MKPFRALILATVLLAPLAAFAANPFEGRISFKLDGDNGPQSMTYSVKGGFSRIEIPVKGAGTPAVIMDTARKEITILMPEQKMYLGMHLIPLAVESSVAAYGRLPSNSDGVS